MGKSWIETVYLQTGIKADVTQFSGPHAAYFTELMERQKGTDYFIGGAARPDSGAVQGRIRAGDEQRLPGRAAVGRSGDQDDERRLLQGLAASRGAARASTHAALPPADPRPLFLAPALLLYAGFTIYPVLRTFYNSVHTIRPHGVEEFVGLANFSALLTAISCSGRRSATRRCSPSSATIADVFGGLLLALVPVRARPARPAAAHRLVHARC